MASSPRRRPANRKFTPTVLFDNGATRVMTHEQYGAVFFGGLRAAVVDGGPAFVPAFRDMASVLTSDGYCESDWQPQCEAQNRNPTQFRRKCLVIPWDLEGSALVASRP